MSATLGCDHRVIDGAVGAEWIGAKGSWRIRSPCCCNPRRRARGGGGILRYFVVGVKTRVTTHISPRARVRLQSLKLILLRPLRLERRLTSTASRYSASMS